MLASLVLVSRLLGLVNHHQPIQVQVAPGVARVTIEQGGQRVAELRGEPWRTILDFGTEIVPQTLTAVAYDAAGNEIGRDIQLINLARPPAEIDVDLSREPSGQLRATVRHEHIASEKARKIQVRLDGKVIGTKDSVLLPALPPTAVHVVDVEVRFADGYVAKAERVFGGQYGEELPSQLTGVLVRQREKGSTDLKTCFQLDGALVGAAGIEEPEARAVFVRDGSPKPFRDRFGFPVSVSMKGIKLRYIWPIAEQVPNAQGSTANLFMYSREYDGRFGIYSFLKTVQGPQGAIERYTDAVAVAGVHALLGTRRRAVVLILNGDEKDASRHTAAIVRRYLDRVGVPLRVWSLAGARPDLVAVWGEVIDISTPELLRKASEEVRKDLESQRIVWVPVTALEGLRVQARPDCAYETVATWSGGQGYSR